MNMHLELREPRTPVLDWEDYNNIKKRYPQTSAGMVNYIFAGGAAVKALLEAESVDTVPFRDASVTDGRTHKDMELYSFRPVFGKKNMNPHDLCYTCWHGPLQQVDYVDNVLPGAGIWFELLRGSYFGFTPLPTEQDVCRASVEGKKYVVLTPEYLIASKLFGTLGLRENDMADSLNLLRRFTVDTPRLREIVQLTKLAPELQDLDLETLEQLVEAELSKKKGGLRDALRPQLEKRYAPVVRMHQKTSDERIPYNLLLLLADMPPEFWNLNDDKKAFLRECVECSETIRRVLGVGAVSIQPEPLHLRMAHTIARHCLLSVLPVDAVQELERTTKPPVYLSGEIDEQEIHSSYRAIRNVLSEKERREVETGEKTRFTGNEKTLAKSLLSTIFVRIFEEYYLELLRKGMTDCMQVSESSMSLR